MFNRDQEQADSHTKIIYERYADRTEIGVKRTPEEVLLNGYLSKVFSINDVANKTVLEIGAGCSQYLPLFLAAGCKTYYANDLIPERLLKVRVDDPRYVELPGDFREIVIPEKVDIIFSTLTMMLVIPILDTFIPKIRNNLKQGGLFISMDANHLCPVSVYRHLMDTSPNPVRLFNPFAYAREFHNNGFVIEKLVPFTARISWSTGIWPLGTSFWLKARKE
jgi:SAM-dependent methyltransferase